MAFCDKGQVRIHYQEAGSGFPLFVIPGGGPELDHRLHVGPGALQRDRGIQGRVPLYHGRPAQRTERPVFRAARDGSAVGLLRRRPPRPHGSPRHPALHGDRLRIGGPFIWKLVQRAPERIVAAVVSQPVGFRKESNPMYDNSMQTWGPALVKQRPDLTMDMIDKFLTRMYVTNADFVFSVPRDVVQGCQAPVLVMPDETPSHPYEPAIESAMLAPKSELTFFSWKDTKEKIPLAVRHVRTFLKARRPA
jgi:hypothetical protein